MSTNLFILISEGGTRTELMSAREVALFLWGRSLSEWKIMQLVEVKNLPTDVSALEKHLDELAPTSGSKVPLEFA